MATPILLTVDDDADVVRGIERDLRSRYSAQYRVLPMPDEQSTKHELQ